MGLGACGFPHRPRQSPLTSREGNRMQPQKDWNRSWVRRPMGIALVLLLLINVIVFLASAQQPEGQLTGNWAVKTPNADGTFRTTYLNLKQDGAKITGSIRVTQFYYLITESTA